MDTNSENTVSLLKDVDVLKQQLNIQVNSMKKMVKRSKLYVIRKLTRNIEKLKKKKGSESQRKKFCRRADNLKKEIDVIKLLSDNDVAVTALYHKDNCEKICFKNDTPLAERAKMRVASLRFVQQGVKEFYAAQAQTHLPTITSILIKLIERRKKKTAKELEKLKSELEETENRTLKKEPKSESQDAAAEPVIHPPPSEEKSRQPKGLLQNKFQTYDSEDSSDNESQNSISTSLTFGELNKRNKVTSLLLGSGHDEGKPDEEMEDDVREKEKEIEEDEMSEEDENETNTEDEEKESSQDESEQQGDDDESESRKENNKEKELKNALVSSSPTKILTTSKQAKAIQLNLNELSMDEEIVIEKSALEEEEEAVPAKNDGDSDSDFFVDANDPNGPDANAVFQNAKEALMKNKSQRTFLSHNEPNLAVEKTRGGAFKKGKWVPFSPNKRNIHRKPFKLDHGGKKPYKGPHKDQTSYQNKKRPLDTIHSTPYKKKKKY